MHLDTLCEAKESCSNGNGMMQRSTTNCIDQTANSITINIDSKGEINGQSEMTTIPVPSLRPVASIHPTTQPIMNGGDQHQQPPPPPPPPSVNSMSSCKFIKDLNDLITCSLCNGYLIDATTIIECLHSFCRACIVKYIGSDDNQSRCICPRCNIQIHKTKPKLNIRSDPTLQDIVYKLVPKLYKNEMNRRKEFYAKHPGHTFGLSNEEKGEIFGERLILSTDDNIQLTIEYFPEVTNPYKLLPFKTDNKESNEQSSHSTNGSNGTKSDERINQRRYLMCKAGMRVLQLKKFIRYKYELDSKIEVDFFYKHELLKDDYTIMDLAYIYSWRRNVPIPLYYIILEPNKNKNDYLWYSNSKLNTPRLKTLPPLSTLSHSSPKKRRLSTPHRKVHPTTSSSSNQVKPLVNNNKAPEKNKKQLKSVDLSRKQNKLSISNGVICSSNGHHSKSGSHLKPIQTSGLGVSKIINGKNESNSLDDDSSTDVGEMSFNDSESEQPKTNLSKIMTTLMTDSNTKTTILETKIINGTTNNTTSVSSTTTTTTTNTTVPISTIETSTPSTPNITVSCSESNIGDNNSSSNNNNNRIIDSIWRCNTIVI
ncbi:hypothetical protein RDWZM_002562 [Blomia tropicalis]|uniref:RING-type domain-containing protein n=1 Tax=Blomia tropicalis TaxID=40697 RepID=A0A9Q0ME76_BLOTA|nr:hypothetical protein RDWZM_002562 [Blomia tropicalis]